jgi:hypothetical protein
MLIEPDTMVTRNAPCKSSQAGPNLKSDEEPSPAVKVVENRANGLICRRQGHFQLRRGSADDNSGTSQVAGSR